MKKIALILALLLAIGGFAVAELEPTVTGEASIAIGLDLDEATWGLKTDSDSSLTLTLVSGTVEKMGEGAWYGVIELADFSIDFDDEGDTFDAVDDDDEAVEGVIQYSVEAPDVTAKITDGNLYFQFADDPDFDADFVAEIEEDEATDFDLGDDIVGGFEFGGAFGPATVALGFGTQGNFEDDYHDDGVIVDFPVAVAIGLDVAPLMVDLAVATGLGDTDWETGLGVQVKADVAPLAVTAAVDYDTATEDVEISAGISADVAPLTVGIDVYYGEYFPGADEDDAVDADPTDSALDLAVGLDADLAPLTVGVDFEYLNITQDGDSWTVDVELGFAASEDITVSADVGYGSDEILSAAAAVEMTGIIDPMTFTLAWEDADDITDVAGDLEEVYGQIVFTAKIAY